MSYYQNGTVNGKSQYFINKFPPDMTAMWDLVKDWNAYVFVYAHDAYESHGNYVFTDAVAPHLIPSNQGDIFGGLFIGVDVHKKFGLSLKTPTTQDTLVVKKDCVTPVTSYPGVPNPR